jgi:flagella basal body P-ring formation protein FlgA
MLRIPLPPRWIALPLLAGAAGMAVAGGLEPEMVERVEQLAQTAAMAVMAGTPARVEVEVGRLDPRLKLAPCRQVQPYLPKGLQMWGRSRIGLRCLDGQQAGVGAARWNVSVPVTVKVYARALVAATALPSGATLTEEHLATAEIDIAAEPGTVFTDAAQLVGRTLVRPLDGGDALRSSSLSKRQWFAAGETVVVRAVGPGYAIASEGQALTPGLEGHDVKVRFDSGRTVTGRAVGERSVEVLL